MEKFSLDGLVEFQEKDRELYKYEQEYSNSAAVKNYKILEKNVRDLRVLNLNLAREAEGVLSQIKDRCAEINKEIASNDNIPKSYASFSDLEDLQTEETILQQIVAKLDKYEKDVAYRKRRLDEIINDARSNEQRINDLIKKARIVAEQKKEAKATLLKEAGPLKKSLDEEAKSLDAEAYAKYTAIRQAKGLPVVVAMSGDSCGACGMDIRIEMQDLHHGEGAECPNCGRIVYRK